MQPTPSAAYRQPAESSARTNADRFEYDLATFAHELRTSEPNLDASDKRLLEDYARGASANGEARYRLITFRRLMAIARRSRRPEHRERLAELVRAECVDGVEPTSLEIAFDQETNAQGPCDIAQRQFERAPTPMNFARCRDAIRRQIAVSKVALQSVLRAGAARQWE